ncbi:HD domain-containing protein [Actinacidiphila glaucinigra]|uniref:HD domain-containing protein n=1 Tax=Actinacidiphila glaucinigra TaxID=235986 RepID=UPI002DD816F3|nr:HD domain-containing protein [Actinacidiphila glaucinigra]
MAVVREVGAEGGAPPATVVLVEVGPRVPDVVAVLGRLTGRGAEHCRFLTGRVPVAVLRDVPEEDAEAAVAALRAAGATAEAGGPAGATAEAGGPVRVSDLDRALVQGRERPLPPEVERLLRDVGAPPRLAAHLRLVHDVACELVEWIRQYSPDLVVDREAVLFGAATHDIGKALHVAELSGPGSAHERAGRALLLARGVAPRLARFAATHGSWTDGAVTMEDLLVSVADKVWKGKRVTELEDLVVDRLAGATGDERWEVFLALDGFLGEVAADADRRLAFHTAFPVVRGAGSPAALGREPGRT